MAQVAVCSQINTKHININPLQPKRRPLYLKTQSVPRCKHFAKGYKNQSVYAVSGTSPCLFSDKYKTHKYSVGGAHSCWMLKWWCITWPVGFKWLMNNIKRESLNFPSLTVKHKKVHSSKLIFGSVETLVVAHNMVLWTHSVTDDTRRRDVYWIVFLQDGRYTCNIK